MGEPQLKSLDMPPWRSPKWGNLGVHFECSGPDPQGPRPGATVKVVILDGDDNVVRTLTERKTTCLDPGYVDFWGSPQCRPAIYVREVVDIAPDGSETVVGTYTDGTDGGRRWWKTPDWGFAAWCQEHGVRT